jgi:hypothetical protein
MTNKDKDNSNRNRPDHIASNDDPAAVSQSNASAHVELDDLASACPDLKLADNQPEPVTEVEKPAADGGAKASPVSPKLRNTNALRHGAYSYGLLSWESKEDFEVLHQRFKEDLKPQGACQEEAVFALSEWTWKRRRVLQGSEISYFRSPVAKGLKSGTDTWDDIVRHQAKVPEYIKNLTTGLRELVDSLSRLSDTIGEHYYWTNTDEGKDIQMQLTRMRSEVGSLASTVREDVIEKTKRIGKNLEKITSLFDHAYQPDEIETQIKLQSMIDREIDKTIKRIIYLKTFNSIEAEAEARKAAVRMPPLLDSPSIIPEGTLAVKESTEINERTKLTGTLEGESASEQGNDRKRKAD